MKRPDWRDVYKGTAHTWRGDEGELVQVTRETARLALNCIHECQAQDGYHHRSAAAQELTRVLGNIQTEGYP